MRSKQDGARPRQAEDLLPLILGTQKAVKNLEVGLTKTNTSVEDFVKMVVGDIENLESQIDGVIGTYYYEGEPTLENIPASEWTTDEEKAEHINDWYYDKDTGYAYKFVQNEDGSYGWELAEDPRIAEALATANAAQETADGKMQVFTTTPTPPYDVGDLLILNEELYRCVIAKAIGENYAEGDFIIATKYTDDTLAKEVQKEVVTVIKNLDALTIRTQTLETNSLTADVANLTYAQITDFNALTGRVGTLETITTKTEELIFGAAGGTSIQTSFSNSVIAVLGDAQIKSAMIEGMSVDKLLAGDISTSKHRIVSDSGHMVLSDNTMTITDDTRVRVQIGKDASADYNMYVWDKSGNLMFDALGLTEKGVTRKIIRDDVVKDDADISASKLNIDSLFTVINEDGSNTLKSSKIYLDDKAQTLDVAFSALTTDVTDLETKQTSQGTQISTIQGQITSKIWQSDITTAVNALDTDLSGNITTLSTQYSTLDQNLDGLSTTVGSHTTQIDSLGTRVTTTETKYTQLDNKFSWVVKSGTSASDFTITDRMAKLATESLVITDSTGASTIISGGKMNIDKIFAQDITATGTITGVTLNGATINLESDSDTQARLIATSPTSGYRAEYSPTGFRVLDGNGNVRIYLFPVAFSMHSYDADGNNDSSTVITPTGMRALTLTATQSATIGDTTYEAGYKLRVVGSTKVEGEIISTTANSFRSVYGSYGFFLRNDGSHTYFMLTNSGDQYGSYNSLRPLYINNSTGKVYMKNGLSVTSAMECSSGLWVSNGITSYNTMIMANDYSYAVANTSGTPYSAARMSTGNILWYGYGSPRTQIFSNSRIDLLSGGIKDTSGNAITLEVNSYGWAVIRPTNTGCAILGNSSYRYKYIYSDTAVDVGSDMRLKHTVKELDDRYLALAKMLVAKSYFLTSMNDGKKHIGYIAQDVEESMTAVGLSLDECAFLHRNWVEREGYVGYELSLTYEELHTISIAALQKEVTELRNELSVAQAKIEYLQLQQLGA